MNNIRFSTIFRLLNMGVSHDLDTEVNRLIENGGRMSIAPPVIPTWLTIERGSIRSIKEKEQNLMTQGFNLDDRTREILQQVQISKRRERVELVRRSVAQLGLEYSAPAPVQSIHRAGASLGLEMCKPEDAIHARLAYNNQPKDEILLFAMEPFKRRPFDGWQYLFALEHNDDERCLRTESGGPGSRYADYDKFVFARPVP